jgi:hypothetical protein
MTMAICWKCGTTKHGAFVDCPGCKARPKKRVELIASLMLTDWFNTPENLQEVGQSIKDGCEVEMPDLNDPRYAALVASFDEFKRLGMI